MNKISFRGKVTRIITKPDGTKIIHVHNNLVVDYGLSAMAALLVGQSVTLPAEIAIGDGTTPPQGSDTDLNNELLRTTCSSAADENTATYISSWAAGAAEGSYWEAGLFGVGMYARIVFPEEDVIGPADTYNLIWDIHCLIECITLTTLVTSTGDPITTEDGTFIEGE